MDIYKLLYIIVGFHICTGCALFIMDMGTASSNGIITETGAQTAVMEMISEANNTGNRVTTDVNGERIHDLCDPDDTTCDSDFKSQDDTSIIDSLLRYVPGAKYVSRFIRFAKFVVLGPYLVIYQVHTLVSNVVIKSLIYMMFLLWHMVIAINVFNWVFDNRGRPHH